MWSGDPLIPTSAAVLDDLFLEAVDRHGDRGALVEGVSGLEVDYAELGRRVERIVAWSAARGLEPGDVVAIRAPNTPPWAAWILAAARIGAAVTGANPAYSRDEAGPMLAGARIVVSGPDTVEVDRDLAPPGASLVALGSHPAATSLADVLAHAGDPPSPRRDPDAVCLLPWSSGTSGLPKAVELDHHNVVAAVRQLQAVLRLTPEDVVLAVAPYSHVLGSIVQLVYPLTTGCSVVTVPRFEPKMFLDIVERYRPTFMAVPPPLAGFLAAHPLAAGRDLGSLQLLAVGGAALAPAVQQALSDRLPGCVVGQGYGLTETTASVCVPERGRPTLPGSVGRLLPGTDLRVVDPETGRECAAVEEGELWVHGPQVMRGYRNDRAATTATLEPGGWLRTGDLGRMEPEGQVVVTGRLKDLIKVDGFQVSPAEVEATLAAHPGVDDVAVAGIPDGRHGQVPVAFVVGTTDFESLAGLASERLAKYKRPAAYQHVDTLPRTPSGKLLRRLLVASLNA